MKLLVWGANPVKIFPGEDCISTPTEVELGDEGDEVLWVGWASAIGKKANGSLFALSPDGSPPLTDRQYPARKIIGGDNALAYLDTSGYIHTLPRLSLGYDAIASTAPTATSSVSRWADVAASETAILGLTPHGQLYKFQSMDGILSFGTSTSASALSDVKVQVEANEEEGPESIALPPLPASTFRLYALETRLFVHIAGEGMQQLLELVQGDDDLGLGHSGGAGASGGKRTYMASAGTGSLDGAGDAGVVVNRTRLVNIDIDALGFTIIPGPKNRLGILTDTGEAYLLDSRTRELELLSPERADEKASSMLSPGLSAKREDQSDENEAKEPVGEPEPEVRLLGIGSGFEVLVRSDGVWVRGENAFGQLGDGTTSDIPTEHSHRLPIDAERVRGVLCSRWTTVLSMK